MDIIDIKPRGYCKGVARAIVLARKTKKENPDVPVTILGSIVHNRHVVDTLEAEGIRTAREDGRSRLELLDDIKEGIVIFSAHGVSKLVRQKAIDLGLTIVDATCEDVASTAELIDRWIEDGGSVLFFGKKGHPEAVGVCEGRPQVHLIDSIEAMAALEGKVSPPILVTNQTTLSIHDTAELYRAVHTYFPEAEFVNEICSATRLRQEAVMEHGDLDMLLVVGDPHSNNTAMLATIGRDAGIPEVHRIEDVRDLANIEWAQDARIGVTSGASTPTSVTERVVSYLKECDAQGQRLPLTELPETIDIL